MKPNYSSLATTFFMSALAATLISPTVGAASGKKITLSQAIEKCTERAIRFGRTPHSMDGDEPPPNLVQDRYRACVYANSGQYPPSKVEYRDSVLKLLK